MGAGEGVPSAAQAPPSPDRYAPFGTVISNRAPSPETPVSRIGIPVIPRIPETRNSPWPCRRL